MFTFEYTKTTKIMKYLNRLSAQLTNPALNKEEVIKEIDSELTKNDDRADVLKRVKFQLTSPTFLREYCIDEIKTFIRKQ